MKQNKVSIRERGEKEKKQYSKLQSTAEKTEEQKRNRTEEEKTKKPGRRRRKAQTSEWLY